MLSVLIIEDELPNRQRLEKMLRVLDKEIKLMGNLQTVRDSINWLQNNDQPDIIFMDIRLTDGVSFEIFNHITITSAVIFITAYDEYALKAFEVNGVDYLLKPLDGEKLARSVQKAMSYQRNGTDDTVMQIVKNMLEKQPVYRSRFLIAFKDRFVVIATTDIAYFLSENRATYLITHGSRRLLIDQSLETLETELDPELFFRITRQVIISLKAIDKIYQSFNGQLKIEVVPSLKESISMSRERSTLLKKWLDQSIR